MQRLCRILLVAAILVDSAPTGVLAISRAPVTPCLTSTFMQEAFAPVPLFGDTPKVLPAFGVRQAAAALLAIVLSPVLAVQLPAQPVSNAFVAPAKHLTAAQTAQDARLKKSFLDAVKKLKDAVPPLQDALGQAASTFELDVPTNNDFLDQPGIHERIALAMAQTAAFNQPSADAQADSGWLSGTNGLIEAYNQALSAVNNERSKLAAAQARLPKEGAQYADIGQTLLESDDALAALQKSVSQYRVLPDSPAVVIFESEYYLLMTSILPDGRILLDQYQALGEPADRGQPNKRQNLVLLHLQKKFDLRKGTPTGSLDNPTPEKHVVPLTQQFDTKDALTEALKRENLSETFNIYVWFRDAYQPEVVAAQTSSAAPDVSAAVATNVTPTPKEPTAAPVPTPPAPAPVAAAPTNSDLESLITGELLALVDPHSTLQPRFKQAVEQAGVQHAAALRVSYPDNALLMKAAADTLGDPNLVSPAGETVSVTRALLLIDQAIAAKAQLETAARAAAAASATKNTQKAPPAPIPPSPAVPAPTVAASPSSVVQKTTPKIVPPVAPPAPPVADFDALIKDELLRLVDPGNTLSVTSRRQVEQTGVRHAEVLKQLYPSDSTLTEKATRAFNNPNNFLVVDKAPITQTLALNMIDQAIAAEVRGGSASEASAAANTQPSSESSRRILPKVDLTPTPAAPPAPTPTPAPSPAPAPITPPPAPIASVAAPIASVAAPIASVAAPIAPPPAPASPRAQPLDASLIMHFQIAINGSDDREALLGLIRPMPVSKFAAMVADSFHVAPGAADPSTEEIQARLSVARVFMKGILDIQGSLPSLANQTAIQKILNDPRVIKLAQTADLPGLLQRANEAFDSQGGKDRLTLQYQAKFKVQSGTAPNADIVYESVMETIQQLAPKEALATPETKPTRETKVAAGLGVRTVVATILWIMGATPALGHVTVQTVSAKMAMAAVSATASEQQRAQDAKTNFEAAAKQLVDAAQLLDNALNKTAASIRPNVDVNPVVASHMAIAITQSEAFNPSMTVVETGWFAHARQALLDFKAAQGNLDQASIALKAAQDRLPKESALYAEIAQTLKEKNEEIAGVERPLSQFRVAPGARTDIFPAAHLFMSMSATGKIQFEETIAPGDSKSWVFDLDSGKVTAQTLTASAPVSPPAAPPASLPVALSGKLPTPVAPPTPPTLARATSPPAPSATLPRPSGKPAKPDSSLASPKPPSPPLVDHSQDTTDEQAPVLSKKELASYIEVANLSKDQLSALQSQINSDTKWTLSEFWNHVEDVRAQYPAQPTPHALAPAPAPVITPAPKSGLKFWMSNKWNGFSHWSISRWKWVSHPRSWFQGSPKTVRPVHQVSQKQPQKKPMNWREYLGSWRPVTWIVMSVIVVSTSSLLGYVLAEPAKKLFRKDVALENFWPILVVMALFAHHAWSPLPVYLSFAVAGLHLRRLGWSRSSEIPSSDLLGASA